MPWRGPEYEGEFPSLGWGLIDLVESYLTVPSGLGYGQPFRFTDAQIRFVVRAHRIDPDTGRFVFRRVVKEGPKGDGKSPVAGVLAFAHLVGPVVFDGWDAAGEPVGRPHPTPWIQIAALSEDQTDNCYMQLRASLAESPAIDEFGIDLGLTRIFLKDKPVGRIEPVTSSGGAREGQPITLAVKEETQYWVPGKHGPALSRTLDRNLVKTGGLSVAVTNAPQLGAESVAESDMAAAARGAPGLYYEAFRGSYVEDLTDATAVRQALAECYDPQATWLNMDAMVEACADPSVPADEIRRFFFNIPNPIGGESWLPDGAFQACRVPGVELVDNEPTWAAVDVALKHDTTAVVACQWQEVDGERRLVTSARVWRMGDGDVMDYDELEAYLRQLHGRFTVRAIAYDPAYFERSAQVLEREGLPMEEMPQSHGRMVPACQEAYRLICGGIVAHAFDPIASDQVVSAARKETDTGWRLTKGRSRKHIDAAIALVMASSYAVAMDRPVPTFFGAWA